MKTAESNVYQRVYQARRKDKDNRISLKRIVAITYDNFYIEIENKNNRILELEKEINEIKSTKGLIFPWG